MRTTLQIEDDVLTAARSMARLQRKSLGQVITELARKGLRPAHVASHKDGFPVFDVDVDAQAITQEMVSQALDE
jgi:hypothetical protein